MKKVTDAGNGDTPLSAIPKDLLFDILESFADIVVFDSGTGDNRLILISCPELLDGLARASMWLADGTFKVVPSVFFNSTPSIFSTCDYMSAISSVDMTIHCRVIACLPADT